MEEDGDAGLPASLIILTDVDVSAAKHLGELAEQPGLDRLFAHCESYPATATPRDRAEYLRRHTVKEQATYVNTTGRTASQIKQEYEEEEAVESGDATMINQPGAMIRQQRFHLQTGALDAGNEGQHRRKQLEENRRRFYEPFGLILEKRGGILGRRDVRLDVTPPTPWADRDQHRRKKTEEEGDHHHAR